MILSGTRSLHSETLRHASRMTDTSNGDHMIALDNFIVELHDQSLWSKMSIITLPCANSHDSLLNIVKDSDDLVLNDNPPHAAFEGHQCSKAGGLNNMIKITGTLPKAGMSNNSFSCGIYHQELWRDFYGIGYYNAVSTKMGWNGPATGSSNPYPYPLGGFESPGPSFSGPAGFSCLSRTAVNYSHARTNGSTWNYTYTDRLWSMTGIVFGFGGVYHSSLGWTAVQPASGSYHTVGMCFLGGGLNETESGNLRNAVQTYMDAVGTGV